MTVISKTSKSGPPAQLTIPWDLTEWVKEETLLDWIRQEVDTLDWTNAKLMEYIDTHPNFRPRFLLNLLTWAYATSMFAASEIEHVCMTDARWRDASQNQPPTEPAIGRFRRENRGLIKWALVRVYRRAVRSKFELGESRFPAGLVRYLEETAATRLDLARQVDRGSSGF